MSGKRQDYISWDEYFMGVAILSGRRSKEWDTTVCHEAVRMMNFRGNGKVRIR